MSFPRNEGSIEAVAARLDAIEATLRSIVRLRTPVDVPRPFVTLCVPDLSPRELEILTYCAAGLSNQEIAAHLTIDERTARTHVSNILSKLETCNRTTAATWALLTGLVSMETVIELWRHYRPQLLEDVW